MTACRTWCIRLYRRAARACGSASIPFASQIAHPKNPVGCTLVPVGGDAAAFLVQLLKSRCGDGNGLHAPLYWVELLQILHDTFTRQAESHNLMRPSG